jgi:hypothetical protein
MQHYPSLPWQPYVETRGCRVQSYFVSYFYNLFSSIFSGILVVLLRNQITVFQIWQFFGYGVFAILGYPCAKNKHLKQRCRCGVKSHRQASDSASLRQCSFGRALRPSSTFQIIKDTAANTSTDHHLGELAGRWLGCCDLVVNSRIAWDSRPQPYLPPLTHESRKH